MPRIYKHIVVVLFVVILGGCAPKITYRPASSVDIQEKATFAVASVQYSPHPLYNSDSDVDFDIAERFNEAMNEALSDKKILSSTPDYNLAIVITCYKQGNAGLNILIGNHMPELFATVSIYNSSSCELIGELQSGNNRGRGGIRGWNRIFDIVAEEFVSALVDSSSRRSSTRE